MAWFDPPECVAARDCLKRGNPAEAARLLLASKYRQHRAVRSLLLDASKRLVETAEEQFRAGTLEAAEAAIQLAAQCAALQADALALERRIAEALRRNRQQQAWLARQLEEAQQLADAGRLHSALDVLAPLENYIPAEQLRVSVKQRLARFARHLQLCKEALRADQAQSAHRHWQRAYELLPDDPQLAELASQIARAMSAAAGKPGHSVPVGDRGQRFLLGDLALVVSSGEVCLGTPRSEGVHVPIQGPLHRRHVVLLRDRKGWRLAVCRDRHGQPCPVAVNGKRVDSLCRLADGDLVQLGSADCTWRFRLPVAGSRTAVLEALPTTRSLVCTGLGTLLSLVVLLDE